ncbi:cytochrome d ubiquinol oxidase subunit II [Pelistega ratti]|nr:cytochrome d ubiquinol oxidase subunit II [Pelistega ratti]
MDITLVWFAIIGLGVLLYVVLDGFDLGIGILFPFIRAKAERDTMMNTVAPVWDGNETWMVLGGAGLFAAFPLAYATILSALYMPITLMALALIFRGVSFEFRFKMSRLQKCWDYAFMWGSILSAFFQGVVLGAVIQGIKTTEGIFSGETFDWLTPFTVLTGIGVVVMYATLGCAWLIYKTTDHLQQKMYRAMPKILMMLLGIFALVLIASVWVQPSIVERWFVASHRIYFGLLVIITLFMFGLIFRAVQQQKERQPFIYTILLLLVAFISLLLSIFPYIIPPSIDIWQAAAPRSSQVFTLIGALIFIPMIIAYSLFSYWVFRGKVRVGDSGYH